MNTPFDTRQLLHRLHSRLGCLLGTVGVLLLSLHALAVDRIGVGPNDRIQSTAYGADGRLYLGGTFTYFGLQTGAAARVDCATGTVDRTFPSINGTVRAVAPDGTGGWYLGGRFTRVGGIPRTNIVQIDSTGAVTAWNPHLVGDVNGIQRVGNTIYFFGSFTTVNGVSQAAIAAVGTDGQLTSWRPVVSNGGVNAMAISDDTIYLGGSLLTVNGIGPRNMMAIGTDGTVLPFNPAPDSDVNSIQIVGSSIYCGGNFVSIGGKGRSHVAELGLDGVATSWVPLRSNGQVRKISVDSDNVYLVGDFSTFNGGFSRTQAAALSRVTGNLTSFNPALGSNSAYNTVLATNNLVYLGGFFQAINGIPQANIAALTTDGQLQSWAPAPDSIVSAISVSGSNMVFGGNLQVCNAVPRSVLAAIEPDGTLSSWAPTLTGNNQRIVGFHVSGSTVYFAGVFTGVNGTARNGFAAVDSSGALTSWNPITAFVGSAIDSMKVMSNVFYISGNFSQINGVSRGNLAAFDSNGNLLPWNPGANAGVQTLEATGGVIYAAGSFSAVGGQTRKLLAAIDANGNVTSWNPNTDGGFVSTIKSLGDTIYLGGVFTTMAGSARTRFAGVGVDGTLRPININLDASVSCIGTFENRLYLGGSFTTVNGAPSSGMFCVDPDGTLFGWNADPQINPLGIVGTSTNLLIYGAYTSALSQLIPGQSGRYLAYFYPVDTTLPTVVNVTSSSATGSYDVGSVIPIQVVFSDPVTVTGTPTLALQTGGAGRVLNYSSGSGTTTLTFNYTVQAGDTSADLDYISTSSLSLNGGNIVETSSQNSVVLTLPAPGAAGSLGANQSIQINTYTPTDISLSANRVVDQAVAGTTVGTLGATDADAGDTFTYSLVSGTGSGGNARFSISGSTLQVQTAPVLADSSYSIRVRATDAAGHFVEKAFTILVMAVKIDPGDYLIADRGPYRSTGTILVVNKVGAVQRVISTQLKDPYDITTDAAGNLIVADYDYDPTGFGAGRGSSIFRINLQTGQATRLVAGKALVTPIGVRVESDGKLLVVDPDYGFGPSVTSAGAVFRIDPGVSTNRLSSLNQFYFLQGLALAPNGDIYVSDFGDGGGRPTRVIKVDKTTGDQTVMTSGGLQRPIGMAVESDGSSLVVADAAARKLVRVTLPGGVQSDVSTDSQFIQPTHVAIEADGSYIVTDGKTSGVVGERRVYRVNKATGAATVLVSDGFFQQPRGVSIAQ